ncbi:MAG: S8 family serine peptidase [Planctomycetota bacterium]|jgi:hypothetical protein
MSDRPRRVSPRGGSTGRGAPRDVGRGVRAAALAALVAVCIAPATARAGGVVVRPAAGASIGQINARFGTETVAALGSAPVFLIDLPAAASPQARATVLAALQRSGLAEWAEPNAPVRTVEGTTGSFFVSAILPDYFQQYTITRINLDLDAPERSGGDDVLVAVLDTGVDASHPALFKRVRLDLARNFLDPRADTADVGNGADDDGDGLVDELVGHGTHLAGLVHLVAPEAWLVPLKVLDSDGVGSSFRVAQAIDYAVQNGADVINLSMTSPVETEVLSHAVEAAAAAGVTVVAAAGNDGAGAPCFPAAHPDAMAVAATDADDLKCGFSNFGGHVDLSAPGAGVVSTLPGGLYGMGDGTSLAAALVSGAAALLRAHPDGPGGDTTVAALTGSASDLDALNPAHAGLLGAGRLDVGAALELAAAGAASDPADGKAAAGPTASGSEKDSFVVGATAGAGGKAPGDVNGDGLVDAADLLAVLLAWGPCPAIGCAADATGDGLVDERDLRAVVRSMRGPAR